MEYKIKQLNVSDIKPDKNQPRKTFEDESLQHLAESILSNGLLNPIEVDENNIITDGERRWRAHKLAKIKIITARVVPNKDKTEKLRRQLIFTLQDEEIPTEERYEAIVRLWEAMKVSKDTLTYEEFCKELGIALITIKRAINYINDKRQNPKAVEGVSAGVWREIRSLPEKEREEVKKELQKVKAEPIVELVKDKREKIQLQKNLEEIKKTKDFSIKITNTEEQLADLKEKISDEIHRIGKLMFYIGQVRRTKLYLKTPKAKESFFKFVDGSIDRVEKWVKDLKNLKDNLEFEIVKE
jgi:ParB family transcriptional regulator, chromosome partitioning protein